MTVIGNIFALWVLILLIYYRAATLAIPVTLILGVCYCLLSRSSRKAFYLYPGSLLLSIGYFLVLTGIRGYSSYLLFSIPLIGLLFGLGIYFQRRQKEFSSPLMAIGHLNVIFLTGLLFFHQSTVNNTLVVFSTLVYALIYLVLTKFRRCSDYLFGTASFLSVAYYFVLAGPSFITPENHLPYFTLFSLVLFLLGGLVQKKKDLATAGPIYVAAIIVPLLSGGISLSRGDLNPARASLITGAIVYVAMLILFKKEVFIYLLTLTLGLLLYSFLEAFRSKFTQQLVVYFLYFLIFLGIFFFMPYLRRLWKDKRPPIILNIVNWKGVLFYSIPVMGLVILFLAFYFLKISGTPGFCGTCHYMKPYVETWAVSTHKTVRCVECHYAPGFDSEVKGKIAGLIQLEKYLSNLYGGKPRAEISDKSCLRKACHRGMDFNRVAIYKKNIKFRHNPHMTRLVRGVRLRCTSCHSHVVKGEHFTVSDTVCFVCHFKGRGNNGVALGSCYLCHGPPKGIVVHEGEKFNHTEFLAGRKKVRCVDCHILVTEGDGGVPRERCLSCHEESKKYTDYKFMHEIHVTKHKVECFECHTEIRHGLTRIIEEPALNCNKCHGKRHSVPEKMYRGTSGKGLPDSPASMFLANVVCEACHKYKTKLIDVGDITYQVKEARGQACDDCHGKGYGQIAKAWQGETKNSLKELKPLLQEVRQKLDSLKGKMEGTEFRKVEKLFQRAQSNYDFVVADRSYGVHNINYTTALLDKVKEDLEK
ncbi:MAG: hypothetical protein GXO98_00370, partial [Nitrospirae bacterium]|nr:hypothetical protein [Nitrospirota bacterium]